MADIFAPTPCGVQKLCYTRTTLDADRRPARQPRRRGVRGKGEEKVRILTDNELKYYAPSVFTRDAWHDRSQQYQTIPTINVINALCDNGFVCVKAMQSRTRIFGKRDYVKHLIRFRVRTAETPSVGDTIPELVLINSHDGTSAYKLNFGLYRLVCANGLIVSEKEVMTIKLVHKGHNNICNDAIYAAKILLFSAAKTARTVTLWQNTRLTPRQQDIYADEVKNNIYESNIDIPINRFLSARRSVDQVDANGDRDLWRTFNIVQEKLITGGIMGTTPTNRMMRSRSVASIDKLLDYNQGLWSLTSNFAAQLRG